MGIKGGQQLHYQAITAVTSTTKGPWKAKANDEHENMCYYYLLVATREPIAISITYINHKLLKLHTHKDIYNAVLTNVSWLTQGLSVRVGRGTALMFHNAFSTPCGNISFLLFNSMRCCVLNHTLTSRLDVFVDVVAHTSFVGCTGQRRKKIFYWENKTKWRWGQARCILTLI